MSTPSRKFVSPCQQAAGTVAGAMGSYAYDHHGGADTAFNKDCRMLRTDADALWDLVETVTAVWICFRAQALNELFDRPNRSTPRGSFFDQMPCFWRRCATMWRFPSSF